MVNRLREPSHCRRWLAHLAVICLCLHTTQIGYSLEHICRRHTWRVAGADWLDRRGRRVGAAPRLTVRFIVLVAVPPFLWRSLGLYRHQYERAGFRMLPTVDRTGHWTGIKAVACAALLLPVSVLPAWVTPGWGSVWYAAVATLLGLVQLGCAVAFASHANDTSARRLFVDVVILLAVGFFKFGDISGGVIPGCGTRLRRG